ncbi:MAG: 1D-myo-inosityl-2-acetamido-2-deoxy-alpha-D-glucopyranoside deacetylase [Pseudonocardiales bacterium]|nr:1D-myo-inosityl-2-acetamido-2-deoxy-alpha-D-glucopyranoside deacetylase [Pseudonocardiales bacterium]
MSQARRLLLVHAHPDDETITTGATIAAHIASGAAVTVITCTLGEEGEILVPELDQLASPNGDQLGGHRMHEMAAAMRALGVTDQRFLGGPGRFRDSGMIGWPANERPRAFWQAASTPAIFDDAVARLVAVIRELRPQVLVTYDENGGYGHPDHIMAHRVAMAAVDRAAGSPGGWSVERVYWITAPRSALAAELARAAELAPADLRRVAVDDLPSMPDEAATTVVDGAAHIDAVLAALAAHATQVSVHGGCYALYDRIARHVSGREYFRRVRGDAAGPLGADGLEHGLFADAPELA